MFPGWPGAVGAGSAAPAGAQPQQQQQQKKRRKKKGRSSSSSSSSSSDSVQEPNWSAWNQAWQGQMAAMWQGQWGGWPQGGGGQQPPQHGMQAGGSAGPEGGSSPGAPVGRGGPGRGREALPPPPGGWPGHLPPGDSPTDGYDHHRRSRSRDGRGGGGAGDGGAGGDEVPIFLEPAIEEIVPVPKAMLGKVIGKQAQTIIEIREKSGAFKVDARDQTQDPCQVKVAGTADAVRKARALIMEVLDSAKTKHVGSVYVEIPKAKIGMVIGLKGAQVNEIQNQTNTKIDVDFDSDPCKCYIKGTADATEEAKNVLLTIAMQIEDVGSEYLDLPKCSSGALIGSQGTRIREFQEVSGARIDVDKTGPRCVVRVSGNPSQVAHAKRLIYQEVENNNLMTNKPPVQTMALPPIPQAPMVVPAHQPSTFPATLSESIARAKAAAEAVKNGLVTAPPGGPVSVPPPPAAPGTGTVVPPPPQVGGDSLYRPW